MSERSYGHATHSNLTQEHNETGWNRPVLSQREKQALARTPSRHERKIRGAVAP